MKATTDLDQQMLQQYADSVWANFGDIIKDDIKCEIIEYSLSVSFDVKYEHPEWGRARRQGSIYVSGKAKKEASK